MTTPKLPLPTDYQMVIRSPPNTVDDAQDFLERVWAERPDLDGREQMVVATIVSELVTNIIQHNPRRDVLCELAIRIEPGRVIIETSDTGDPTAADHRDMGMPGEEAERGRGLPLIHLLADSVEHRREDGRNLWRICRSS